MRYLIILFLLPFGISAQNITWSDGVAEIIYNNCSRCHRLGGIAPFELMSYQDAVDASGSVYHVVVNNEMPPWPAAPHYRRFAQQEILTYEEKSAILAWMDQGFEQGNPANEPLPPYFAPNGSNLETIDFTVAIEPYTLQSNTDEYRWFAIENPYSDTIYINKI